MNAKQLRFCQEYMIDFNGTQAAIRAGYSKKTARFIATENLTKPNIQAKIAELVRIQADRLEITSEAVMQELAAIAFSRIDDVLTVEGGQVIIKPSSQWSPSARVAIQNIKQTQHGISITMHSKVAALEKLMMRFGLNQPDPDIPTGAEFELVLPTVVNIGVADMRSPEIEAELGENGWRLN